MNNIDSINKSNDEEFVSSAVIRQDLRTLDRELAIMLNPLSADLPRHKVVLDPQKYRRLEDAVKFLEKFREEVKAEYRRLK